MRRLTLFLAGVAIVGNLAIAQDNRNDLRVMVVGLAARNYQESMDFYTKVMGFKAGFSFSPDGKRMNTYFQLSRDSFIEMSETAANAAPGFTQESFLEMQSATEAMPAGITHVHIQVPDVAAAVARLRQLGLPAPARGATTPKTATDPGVTQPSNVKSANVYDPQGLRLELNELIPESQTKKAMDAWK